jgi:hypothetical protein
LHPGRAWRPHLSGRSHPASSHPSWRSQSLGGEGPIRPDVARNNTTSKPCQPV